jgi:TPR repeat protein
LKATLDKAKSGDLVVVAFAGHGLQFADDKDAYFCPRDAKPFKENKDTLISLGQVYKDMDQSFAGVKVLLVDACRSDPDKGRGRGVDRPPLHDPAEGLYAFYSCKEGERAYEHADLKHGVFFYNLLEGLRGKAARGDDVSVEEMATYVRKNVPDQVGKLFDGVKQNPTIETSRVSGKPTVLLPKRAEEVEMEKEIAALETQIKKKGVVAFEEYCRKNGPVRAAAWKAAAERGSSRGMYLLALAHEYGAGVPKNAEVAVNWYRRAAKQEFPPAQCAMGYCYETGDVVVKSAAEAIAWFRKAAEQGDFLAQFKLGYAYDEGRGVDKDAKEAVTWYRKSADQGFVLAQHNLAVAYETGSGIDPDAKEAVKWYRNAAEQGYFRSQLNLGLCYEYGIGMDKNAKEAFRWYSKAADQGDATAQYYLGWCYEDGIGVAKDAQEAIKWYRKAATQGHKDAAAALKRLGANP